MCQVERVAGGRRAASAMSSGLQRPPQDGCGESSTSPGSPFSAWYFEKSLHMFLRSKARTARAAVESAELDQHLCFSSLLCPFRSLG